MGDWVPTVNSSGASDSLSAAFEDATAAGNATGILGVLSNGMTLNASDWDSFYERFTERQEGACLNPDSYGTAEVDGDNYGDEITFFVRILIAVVVTLRFLKCASSPLANRCAPARPCRRYDRPSRARWSRWHLDARSHWPTKRLIPDLQEKGPHRAKVQCLLFNCFPANAHLGIRINLLPVVSRRANNGLDLCVARHVSLT